MSQAESWARIRALFDEVAELGAVEAEVRVKALAGGDVELESEVRRLLAADREAGETPPPKFVLRDSAESAWSAASDDRGGSAQSDPLLGRRFGNWTLERPLGRGGMGRVYLARRADRAFEKTAALKLLRGALDNASFRDRFARERRIVATLDHPGIARLLDGGESADGLPFLVLEAVDGSDLVAWADERRLDVAGRLRLFRKVLEAVAYAHRRLIVHRDLKPSNILVTADGSPKLLDFGIARILDQEEGADSPGATRTGEAMLTPEYASPEQRRGDPVATGSDIYSLGIVLYELLVGSTPLRGRTSSSPAGTAREGDRPPERPSTAARKRSSGLTTVRPDEIRGDLDAIVLKAIRPEADERYRSVEELAAEIDRFLEGRPVEARRGSNLYRLAKFARRHRVALVAAGLAVTVFAVTLTHSALRLRAERDRAERRFAETRELARSLLFDLHDSIRDLDGATAARRLLVERGLHYLERLRDESTGDPTLRREVVEGYLRLAEIFSDRRAAAGLELTVEAGDLLESARALIEPHAGELGEAADRRLLVQVLGATVRRRFTGEIESEVRLAAAQRAVEVAATLVRDSPESADDQHLHAEALRDLADQLGFAGRIAEAAGPIDRASVAARRAAELRPADRELELAQAELELAAAKVRFRVGLHREARASLQTAREILARRAAAEPGSVELRDRFALALAEIGSDAWQNGRPEEGMAALEQSCELLAATVAADPANRQGVRRLTSARTELALAMVASGRIDEALARHGDALAALSRARERPGAPAFLIYDEAFLAAQMGKAAALASRAAGGAREQESLLARAREWYERALTLHAEGVRGGTASHQEPQAWEQVQAAAAELGVD